MTRSYVGLELDNGGVLMRFLETGVENGGARHLQEARYVPHSSPPPYHCHPSQDERFTVLEGALFFRVDGVDRIVPAGEALEIKRGAFHLAHNPHDSEALVTWETRPALRTAELFVALSRAAQGRARPPLLDAIAILNEYQDVMQLAKPPAVLRKIVFGCLAPFGRRALSHSDPG